MPGRVPGKVWLGLLGKRKGGRRKRGEESEEDTAGQPSPALRSTAWFLYTPCAPHEAMRLFSTHCTDKESEAQRQSYQGLLGS